MSKSPRIINALMLLQLLVSTSEDMFTSNEMCKIAYQQQPKMKLH